MYFFKVSKRNPNLESIKNNKNNNTDTKHKTVIEFWYDQGFRNVKSQ